MKAREISKYLDCHIRTAYELAERNNWKKEGQEYQITTSDLDVIKTTKGKLGRRFECDLLDENDNSLPWKTAAQLGQILGCSRFTISKLVKEQKFKRAGNITKYRYHATNKMLNEIIEEDMKNEPNSNYNPLLELDKLTLCWIKQNNLTNSLTV